MEQEPLPSASKTGTKALTVTALRVIIAALAAGGGVYAYQKGQNDKAKEDLQSQISSLQRQVGAEKNAAATPIATAAVRSTATPSPSPAAWLTYTNARLKFSIRYPSDWVETDAPPVNAGSISYSLGAVFKPSAVPASGADEKISIASSYLMGQSQEVTAIGTSFESYARIAAMQDIQGYGSLNTITPVTTDSGITGYVTTWNVTNLHGLKSISDPIAYLPITPPTPPPGSNVGRETLPAQLTLNDPAYLDTFNQMLKTFKVSN